MLESLWQSGRMRGCLWVNRKGWRRKRPALPEDQGVDRVEPKEVSPGEKVGQNVDLKAELGQ